MMKVQFYFIVFIALFSCKSEKKHNEIEIRWQEFLEVVEQKRIEKFRGFTSKKIRCYWCLENTKHEQEVLEYLQENDPNWFSKVYNENIYIPVDKFIDEDFELIFTNEFVEILKTRETIFSKRQIDNFDVYEVLVTTTKPTFGHEGGQHTFQFRKIEGIYRLSEISTIP